MDDLTRVLTPLAERRSLDFNVNGAIRRRVKQAHEKSQAENLSQPRPRLSFKAATVSEIAEFANQRAETLEIQVESETHPLHGDQEDFALPDASADAPVLVAASQLPKNAATAILVDENHSHRISLAKETFTIGLPPNIAISLGGRSKIGDAVIVSFDQRFRILDPKQPDPISKSSRRGLMCGLMGSALIAVVAFAWWTTRITSSPESFSKSVLTFSPYFSVHSTGMKATRAVTFLLLAILFWGTIGCASNVDNNSSAYPQRAIKVVVAMCNRPQRENISNVASIMAG